jgi:hypothetical protein
MPTLINPTLANLRTKVRQFIDEKQQANFSDSDINWAINTAQQEVATEISLVDEQYFVNPTPTVITSVAGTRFYALAADVWKVIRLEDVTTGLRIDFDNFSNLNNFYQNVIPPIVASSQMGYNASIVGNSFAFTPTPSTNGIQAQYWYVPILQDMTSDSDTSVLPRNFVDLLPIKAAIDMIIEDEGDTSALERMYSRRWAQMIKATRNRQQQNPRGVTRVSQATPYSL